MDYNEWEVLKDTIEPLVDGFVEWEAYAWASKDVKLIEELQQNVIEVGTMLEECYQLQGTEVIRWLEQYCEMLYDWSIHIEGGDIQKKENNWKDFRQVLVNSLDLQGYQMSVVVIIKNERKYILEWLEYHLMVGVDHFYIYDNESTDGLRAILQDYIDEGVVTYHEWPGKAQQLTVYNHALEQYRMDTKYMAFIDADEFIVPVEDRMLPDIVDEIIDTYKDYFKKGKAGGVAVNWRCYGYSGHDKMIEGLITRNYCYRGENMSYKNRCVKVICNPRKVVHYGNNPHEVVYMEGYRTLSENGSYIDGPWFFDGICNKLRINHYFSKSREEFEERLRKGKADSKRVWSEELINLECEKAEEYSKVYDFIMEKYVDELEERVKNRKKEPENMEKVTVIIPTYNRCEKLKKSIDSVLQQTYTEIELLIVDDDSTDNTQEMVETIADERVRYVKLAQNMGAAAARNEGVRLATTELIAFHDSDDIWRPDKLEKQMRYWGKHPEFSMIYCAFLLHKNGRSRRAPELKDEIVEGDMYPTILVQNCIGTPTMLMRKDCFWEVGGFNTELRCLEDWEFVLRFAQNYLIGCVNEELVDAYFTEGSVMSRVAEYFETKCYMIACHKQYLAKYQLFDVVVGKMFKEATNIGILEEVKELLQSFLTSE